MNNRSSTRGSADLHDNTLTVPGESSGRSFTRQNSCAPNNFVRNNSCGGGLQESYINGGNIIIRIKDTVFLWGQKYFFI